MRTAIARLELNIIGGEIPSKRLLLGPKMVFMYQEPTSTPPKKTT